MYTICGTADNMQWLSSVLLCLLAILETCSADFVFTFDLNSFTTEGFCDAGGSPECETYLRIFCLRGPSSQQSQDDNDCPLGTSDRVNDANTAITRTIVSPQPWPVSWFRSYNRLVLKHSHTRFCREHFNCSFKLLMRMPAVLMIY